MLDGRNEERAVAPDWPADEAARHPLLEAGFVLTRQLCAAGCRIERMAYVSDETGDAEIYVQPFPDGQPRLKVSSSGGREPRWRADGRELFYRALDDRLMAVAVTPGAALRTEAARPLFRLPIVQSLARTKYVPSRDGQRFLVVTPIDQGAPPRIDVILNWTALLTDR